MKTLLLSSLITLPLITTNVLAAGTYVGASINFSHNDYKLTKDAGKTSKLSNVNLSNLFNSVNKGFGGTSGMFIYDGTASELEAELDAVNLNLSGKLPNSAYLIADIANIYPGAYILRILTNEIPSISNINISRTDQNMLALGSSILRAASAFLPASLVQTLSGQLFDDYYGVGYQNFTKNSYLFMKKFGELLLKAINPNVDLNDEYSIGNTIANSNLFILESNVSPGIFYNIKFNPSADFTIIKDILKEAILSSTIVIEELPPEIIEAIDAIETANPYLSLQQVLKEAEALQIKTQDGGNGVSASLLLGYDTVFDNGILLGGELNLDVLGYKHGSENINSQELVVKNDYGFGFIGRIGYTKLMQDKTIYLNLGGYLRHYDIGYRGFFLNFNEVKFVPMVLLGAGIESKLSKKLNLFLEFNHLFTPSSIQLKPINNEVNLKSSQLKLGVRYYL